MLCLLHAVAAIPAIFLPLDGSPWRVVWVAAVSVSLLWDLYRLALPRLGGAPRRIGTDAQGLWYVETGKRLIAGPLGGVHVGRHVCLLRVGRRRIVVCRDAAGDAGHHRLRVALLSESR